MTKNKSKKYQELEGQETDFTERIRNTEMEEREEFFEERDIAQSYMPCQTKPMVVQPASQPSRSCRSGEIVTKT